MSTQKSPPVYYWELIGTLENEVRHCRIMDEHFPHPKHRRRAEIMTEAIRIIKGASVIRSHGKEQTPEQQVSND